MAITIFPNIKLLNDISPTEAFWRNRPGCITDAEYSFYWYCSLLQEDYGQGMMVCDDDEFLLEAYNILELSHNRMAHA